MNRPLMIYTILFQQMRANESRALLSMDLTLCQVIIISIVIILTTKLCLQVHFSKPLALPILGHLHLLRNPIHQSLTQLAKTHGHVLLLRFGSRRVLVVSSPSAAEQCFTKNDIIFANRPRILPAKYLGYNFTSLVFSPFTARWRAHRRFTALQAFSPSRLSDNLSSELRFLLRGLYSDHTQGFHKTEIRSWFFDLTLNLMMVMITGKRFQGEEKRKYRKIMEEIFFLSGASSLEDFLPFVRWFGFSTMRKRMERVGKQIDESLQELLLEERSKLRNGDHDREEMKTIIGNLLLMQEKVPEYYTDIDIKGILLSLITGGTETTSGTMEWAMALLVNHPEVLKKVRDEIKEHVGHARLVMDSDISKLKYLNNVVKETLRLFPPGPLLVPHESSGDCIVEGVCIPKGTMLLVNAYAMQRDPDLWEDPMEFKPDRFDENQQGFKYIPFGFGRRRCPGESMGWKVMALGLGVLIQCFEWVREGEELVDLSEGAGLSMPLAKPLEVIYRPCPEILDVLSQL